MLPHRLAPGFPLQKMMIIRKMVMLLMVIMLAPLLLVPGMSKEVWFASASNQGNAGQQPDHPGSEGDEALFAVYIPLSVRPDPFVHGSAPVWSHDDAPSGHEVTLFRQTFVLDEPFFDVQLSIFADTRYELWVDGDWMGRGPARFSRSIREYDNYSLDTLAPGKHVVAVLVQWAPNSRRSESTTPYLRATLTGKNRQGDQIRLNPEGEWKALQSNAWQGNSDPVHEWGLIGPTELLDLRKLPADWMAPGFDDSAWPAAVVKGTGQIDYQPLIVTRTGPVPNPPDNYVQAQRLSEKNASGPVQYLPRSIPFLSNEEITPTLIEAGRLSPGRQILEFEQSSLTPYQFEFSTVASMTVTLETLSESGPPAPEVFQIDGRSLSWRAAGEQRPDVYVASPAIERAGHALTIAALPANGLTFSISTEGVQFTNLPFGQGILAGRRLLLAEPVQEAGAAVSNGKGGWNVKPEYLPAYLVFDLGRTVHGRVSAEVTGPAGTVIDTGWDERLLPETSRPLPYPGSLHPFWDQVDSWILDGGTRPITTLDSRSGRYILIAIWGNGPVSIDQLRIDEEVYPVSQAGSLQTSSELMNTVWQTGAGTVRLNRIDAYTDGPWRERGQWWGDAYIEDQVNQAVFGDVLLLRRGVMMMMDAVEPNGRPRAMAPNGLGNYMLDYGMLSIHSLQEYVQLTGDYPFAQRIYPAVVRLMRFIENYINPATGLLDLPRQHWSLTAYIDPLGYDSRYGQSTALNAMYYETLQRAAGIAEALGDSSGASGWRRQAEALRQQINTRLYLPDDGLYLTSIYSGTQIAPSPHAQAWALAYGIPPEEQEEAVSDALIELLSKDPASPNVDLSGMYWVLEALGRTGRVGEALQVIETYYGYVLNKGATTWWEKLGANTDYKASLSHGWSSSPTWFLTTYVLGAEQVGPDRWVVRPALTGLDEVSGSVPVSGGLLQVSWTYTRCEEASLSVDAPPGSSGEVVIPWDTLSSLTLDGVLTWEDGAPLVEEVTGAPDGIHVELSEGLTQIHAQPSCQP